MARRCAGQGSNGDPLGRPGARRRPIRGPSRLARGACVRLCPRWPGAVCRVPPASWGRGRGRRRRRSQARLLSAQGLRSEPEPLFQLDIEGLPSKFPPLRAGAGGVPGGGGGVAGRARRNRGRGCLATVAVLVFTGGGSGTVEVGSTSLAVIDGAKSNKVVDAVDLGFKSNLITTGAGHIWVVDPKGSTLRKIDPRTHEVKTSSASAVGAGAIPFGLAGGRGRRLGCGASRQEGSRARARDPRSEIYAATIPYGGRAPTHLISFRLEPLAVGAGAVWAIEPGGRRRLAHRSARRQAAQARRGALRGRAGRWDRGQSGSPARLGVTKLDAGDRETSSGRRLERIPSLRRDSLDRARCQCSLVYVQLRPNGCEDRSADAVDRRDLSGGRGPERRRGR